MKIFKCHNCKTRGIGKTAFEVWTYLKEESALWGALAVCDDKGHLTCYDCSSAYCTAKEKAEARAKEAAARAALEAEKQAEAEARAMTEKKNIFVIETRDGLLVCSEAEIWNQYRNYSIQVIYTAKAPEQPKDGEDVAAEARPGDVVIYTNDNDQEQEGVYVRPDPSGRGIMVSHSGIEVAVKYRQINGLNKAEAAPASDQPAPEDEDARKLAEAFDEVQASRVAHASACGFTPQEGDICVNFANRAANAPYVLFRYEGGLWKYHTQLQVGLLRYLEGYHRVVVFGQYEEGYYSPRQPGQTDDQQPAPYMYVAITRAQQPLQIPMPASITPDVPVPDQTPEQVAALADWLKSHDYSRIDHAVMFQYEGGLKVGKVYILEPHYGSGLMLKCGNDPMDVRAYVPLEHIVKIYIDPSAIERIESEQQK